MSNQTALAKTKYDGLIQFIKFGIVGVVNTAVDWVVFYLLIHTIMPGAPKWAKAISFLVAMINSYIWNTVWTFKKEYEEVAGKGNNLGKKSGVLVRFTAVSLVGWAINVWVFAFALSRLNFHLLKNEQLLSLVFASGAAIVWNFFANKLWTYKK